MPKTCLGCLHHLCITNFPTFAHVLWWITRQRKGHGHSSVFCVSPAELDSRLNLVALQLAATLEQAKGVVRRLPQIAKLQSTTVGLHVSQLHGLGFSSSQVNHMCLKQPALLTLDYTSKLQGDKWAFSDLCSATHSCFNCCMPTSTHVLAAKQAGTSVGVPAAHKVMRSDRLLCGP